MLASEVSTIPGEVHQYCGRRRVMASRRKFSDEYKREAVRLATEPGVTKSQVGRELGINAKWPGYPRGQHLVRRQASLGQAPQARPLAARKGSVAGLLRQSYSVPPVHSQRLLLRLLLRPVRYWRAPGRRLTTPRSVTGGTVYSESATSKDQGAVAPQGIEKFWRNASATSRFPVFVRWPSKLKKTSSRGCRARTGVKSI